MAEHHAVSTSTMPPVVQQQQRRRPSHTTRPKIKIIHIIAPEIIKTDVANFRDLVQRLTGKQQPTGAGAMMSSTNMSSSPPLVDEEKKEMVRKRPSSPPEAPVTAAAERSHFQLAQQEPSSKKQRKIKCEVKVQEGGGFVGDYYGLDCNDELWMDLNPGGSFLSFLEEEELDDFQGLVAPDHDFLQVPIGPPARMDMVGEMYAS